MSRNRKYLMMKSAKHAIGHREVQAGNLSRSALFHGMIISAKNYPIVMIFRMQTRN